MSIFAIFLSRLLIFFLSNTGYIIKTEKNNRKMISEEMLADFEYNNLVNDMESHGSVVGKEGTPKLQSAFIPVQRMKKCPLHGTMGPKTNIYYNEIRKPKPIHGTAFSGIPYADDTTDKKSDSVDTPFTNHYCSSLPNVLEESLIEAEDDDMYTTFDLSKDGYVHKKKPVREDIDDEMFISCDPSFRRRGKVAELKTEEICYEVYMHKQTGFITTRPLAWASAFEDYILSNQKTPHRWMYKIDNFNDKKKLYCECILTVIFQERKMIIIHMYLRSGVVMIKGTHYKDWCMEIFPLIKENVESMEHDIKKCNELDLKLNNDLDYIDIDLKDKSSEMELLWQQNNALRKALRHLENGFHILQFQLDESDKEKKNLVTDFNESITLLERKYDAKLKLFMDGIQTDFQKMKDGRIAALSREIEELKKNIDNKDKGYESQGFKAITETKDTLYKNAFLNGIEGAQKSIDKNGTLHENTYIISPADFSKYSDVFSIEGKINNNQSAILSQIVRRSEVNDTSDRKRKERKMTMGKVNKSLDNKVNDNIVTHLSTNDDENDEKTEESRDSYHSQDRNNKSNKPNNEIVIYKSKLLVFIDSSHAQRWRRSAYTVSCYL